METPPAAGIDTAHRGGVVRSFCMQQMIVYTTVMPQAIAHPTDRRLLDKSRQHLVKMAQEHGDNLLFCWFLGLSWTMECECSLASGGAND